jgi:dynein heavy chain
MPIFGGQKGPEIAESLTEIEATFNRHLLELRKFKDIILDVKATSWHEYYNKYNRIQLKLIKPIRKIIMYF